MWLEKNCPGRSQNFLSLQVSADASYSIRVERNVSRNNPFDLFFPESEPRDAGTDQRSSGIIRLHTIKQIIDRVSIPFFFFFLDRAKTDLTGF